MIKFRIIASQDGSGGDKLETVDVGRGEDYVKKNINFNKKIDDKFKAEKKESCKVFEKSGRTLRALR